MRQKKIGLTRGLFIAFEGIDGGGKTTQALILKDRLESMGLNVRYVKEPTSGPWGIKIRRIAEKGREGISPEEELDYFIQDRKQDVEENILPVLADKGVVIADRYFYSTIAYQSVLGLSADMIRHRNGEFPVPDIVFMLELTTEKSQKRITVNRNETANIGYEQKEFLNKVKRVFDAMKDPNIIRINSEKLKQDVSEEIFKHVDRLLK